MRASADRKADGRRMRQPRRDVDLDVDDERVDAAEGAGADASEHRFGVPRASRWSNGYERNSPQPVVHSLAGDVGAG